MNARSKIACYECGEPVGETKRNDKKFCCLAHKDAYMNRRKVRGQQLLDLVMIDRFDRKLAYAKKVRTVYYRMISNWREEDKAANRTSWLPLTEVFERQVEHVAVKGRVSRKAA